MRKNILRFLLLMVGSTLASLLLSQIGINKDNILMIFIIGVLGVAALTDRYRYGIIASFVSVLVFNYFFTMPLYTLEIADRNDFALMLFFLVAAMIASALTARFQRQLLISKHNEQTAKLMSDVTQRLQNVNGEDNIVKQALHYIKENLALNGMVELYGKPPYYSEGFVWNDSKASNDFVMPGLSKPLGTLKIVSNNIFLSTEQRWLCNTVAIQLGIALDREFVSKERENIRISMEREHLKSNLLRSVSHDLRTPLTGIAGASRYILERGQQLDREAIIHLVGDINDQAVWLTTLVENMLNMIRIDSGKLVVDKQFEVVDDVVNEAANHVVGLNERKFAIVRPEELLTAPMDGRLIVQVLINLLNNAVTHTPKGGEIKLIINPMEESIEFRVEDSGTGIDPEIEQNLFESFVTSGKIGADGKKGIGLGLAICKAFVEAHGGEIHAGKSVLGGALFIFSVPLKENG